MDKKKHTYLIKVTGTKLSVYYWLKTVKFFNAKVKQIKGV